MMSRPRESARARQADNYAAEPEIEDFELW